MANEQFVSPPGGANGIAIASLVLGIVALALMCVRPEVAWVCGLLAIIFGFMGRSSAAKGAPHAGKATAGLILGIIGLLFIMGCLAVLGIGGAALWQAGA